MAKAKPFKNQNYYSIKKSLLRRRLLFTDSEFPHDDATLIFGDKRAIYADVKWMRISKICAKPKFVADGRPSEKNVVQGALGDCWFVAACGAMTKFRDLWTRVIPDCDGQEYDERRPEAHCGIFHFRFWRFGIWYDVVVDDFLPARNGRLIFARSRHEDEFWCALLEKAFAKFHGSYERLIGGSLADALVDISGGVPETVDIKDASYRTLEKRKAFHSDLVKSFDSKSLILAAVEAKNAYEIEKETPSGLLKGHAYSVSAFRTLTLDAAKEDSSAWNFFKQLFKGKDRVNLVRLRNPWGRKEWKCAWSDGSPEWQRINAPQRKKLDLNFEEDGEFWMAFDDFMANFAFVTVCNMRMDAQFYQYVFEGRWTLSSAGIHGLRAGGSPNNKETFLCNPQYLFEVDGSRKTDIVVSLLQNDKFDGRKGRKNLSSIGVTVITVEHNRNYRIHQLRCLDPAGMSDFVNARTTFFRLNDLSIGRYVVIPSTFRSGEEGEFFLRFYSTTNVGLRPLTYDSPADQNSSLWCCRAAPSFACVTRVKISHAKNISYTHAKGYFVALCTENQRWCSQIVSNTVEPHWNFSTLIYRRSVASSLRLELWAVDGLISKKRVLMGEAEIETLIDQKSWQYEITVLDALKNRASVVVLTTASSNDSVFGL